MQFFAVVFEHSSVLHCTPTYKEHTVHALIIRVAEALQIRTKTRLRIWGGAKPDPVFVLLRAEFPLKMNSHVKAKH